MTVTVSAPSVEHHRDPIGIGERRPRLSWKISADVPFTQEAYELELDRGDGPRLTRVESAEQVLVPWPGVGLSSRERVSARIRVIGRDGSTSEWSPATLVEAGLLYAEDWSALPAGAAWAEDPDSDDRRPSLVRRGFDVEEGLVRASLYISAHGLYEAELNGSRIGDDALSPGWTVYPQRLRYYTYDVTGLLRPGSNVIGAWLGDGWYRGRLGWRGGFRNVYGTDLSLIAQLELHYADGRIETVATDPSWSAAPSPILRTGIYDGEIYDARDEQAGWSSPGFDDAAWSPVALSSLDHATLVAPTGPPVRSTEEVRPIEVITTPSGATVLDFGQNLVGRIRMHVTGAAGDTVTIRTAEVMQEGGIYTRPLRGALSTDVYTLSGAAGGEEWEPRFTFHGFRYAEVSGWPGDIEAAVAAGDLVARVYHTDLERTGWFESSNPDVNKLHQNIVWGMRGNFVDLPTDCPQRDERVGWTGDIQVFAPTASFLYDVSGMLRGWLRDVAAEQLPDGTVPWYVPVIPSEHMWTPIRPGAAWGDVAVLTPATLFESFGDRAMLDEEFPTAARWVDLVEKLAGDDRLWRQGFQLGDWLDPDAPPDAPAQAKTEKHLVATAYFAWSTAQLAEACAHTARQHEATHYRELAAEVRAAFCGAYVLPDGRMTSDTQTAYALAIAFDLLPDAAARALAGNRLAELVALAGNRISTGFVGTPIVNHALTATGHLDTAYAMLLERECPSWLYQVDMGATTVWERWDSMLPDGTVNPGQMTSFNHYAFGAVADWMHRVVAGISPAAPGYRKILFRPQPGGGLTRAAASHETPYGLASISWTITDGVLTVDTVVPVGTTAVLELDGREPVALGPGRHTATAEPEGVGIRAQSADPRTAVR
ncbi:MAG: Bacterial alpha-L-rhamnosidase [Rhodoglobus sp.]|nr:Bacterial alpha-L-rhamnosidase [Rhodoglobus sp.]